MKTVEKWRVLLSKKMIIADRVLGLAARKTSGYLR